MIETTVSSRLSQAALETLAIIAYRQPITRVEVDEIRGVKSDGPVQTLVSRFLIEECGRKETSGRPILYQTTKEFLTFFGLASLDELPPYQMEIFMRRCEKRIYFLVNMKKIRKMRKKRTQINAFFFYSYRFVAIIYFSSTSSTMIGAMV